MQNADLPDGCEVRQLGWLWYVLHPLGVLGSGITRERAVEHALNFIAKHSTDAEAKLTEPTVRS